MLLQCWYVSSSTLAAEVFSVRSTPTNDPRAALPSLHVLRVGGDPAVEILDGIHSAKLLVERVADAELLKGERRVESFEHGCGRTGMVGFEKVGEILGEPPPRAPLGI